MQSSHMLKAVSALITFPAGVLHGAHGAPGFLSEALTWHQVI